MNNEQFRRLIIDNAATASSKNVSSSSDRPSSSQNGTTAGRGTALGSRMRSSIPMTPRAVSGVDFARQLAAHRRESQEQPPAKKFKASAGPKGYKYAPGYQDRASRRQIEGDKGTDDKEERIRALEELLKLGQIDEATFNRQRAEIGVGGQISSTHLIKGLDWQLLERVKAGEDISAEAKGTESGIGATDNGEDDDEFERLLDEREGLEVKNSTSTLKQKKKGNLAPLAQVGSKRMTRDEILKQLKASRLAAALPPESMLGNKFKKIGVKESDKQRWIETDANGRQKEILVITDAEGKTKRKVRWLNKPGERKGHLLAVDKNSKPLGMEVPADVLARTKPTEALEMDEDDDIFAGVGDDYNPLADADEDTSSDEEGEEKEDGKDKPATEGQSIPAAITMKDERQSSSIQRRDYFSTAGKAQLETPEHQLEDRSNSIKSDPTILEALKKAASIKQHNALSEDDEANKDSALKHKSFLEEAKRRERADALDLDMGFGESRFGDDDDEEFFEQRDNSNNKRKRGPKKKKGDKNDVGTVMRILEGRDKGADVGKGGKR